ncbi:MAG: ABC transporter permease [Actinobacteria bacterium]|nr:MAG: ABC transporter permease [Actinomycetota bacterium]
MATVAAPERIEAFEAPLRRTPKRSWKNLILPIYTKLIIAYLLVPIAVMILYSFNANTAANTATAPKVSFRWQGFTGAWWKQWNGVPDLTSALWNSLLIAVLSTIVATILGTMIALALVRYRFRGSGTLEIVMFLNIAAPEIVLGAALLSFFVLINFQQGLLSIFVAHVMFNIAFVAIVVRARLSGFNREIEEAAQDLYADAVQTFIKVTLPLIWPGILAGALLAFALSIDDFVTTNFVAGQTVTFPLWVYGAVKVGIPPQVFVMGTAIFLAGVVIAFSNVFSSRRKGRTMVRAETEDMA